MAKPAKSQFVCQNCGAMSPRWAGKCVACGEWNTLIEEADVAAPPGSGLTRSSKGRVVELETLTQTTDKIARIPTGLAELDRRLGEERRRQAGHFLRVTSTGLFVLDDERLASAGR
jgi:DNA repair protein RadA/Sms